MIEADEIEVEPKIPLVEGLSLGDLLHSEGAVFCVQPSKDPLCENDTVESEFDTDDIIRCANMEMVDIGDTSTMPFEQIRSTMTKLDDAGLVMKRIKRQGIGEVVKPNSLITVHYNAYFEFNDIPFDSTSLRGQPARFHLSRNDMILGFNMAISTMRKFEKADFIMDPSVAFGKLGCPPRIPANIEVYFEIEVIDWHEDVPVEVSDVLSQDAPSSWEKTKEQVVKNMAVGIAYFKDRNLKEAKYRFRKVINAAENCNLKNEEEEQEQQKLLYKAHINLAIVLNEMPRDVSAATQACNACKEACKILGNEAKPHLQWARALINLGDYDRAKQRLKRAKSLSPRDQAVNAELIRVDELIEKDKRNATDMCKRMFQPQLRQMESTEEEKPKQEKEESEEIKQCCELLRSFKLDEKRNRVVLPTALTAAELESLKNLAGDLGLHVSQNERCVSVTKPKSS